MDNTLDIITVFNPDPEPFEIVYNNQSYGVIEPGMARRMPRFLAKLAVKHLIDRILNRQDIPTNNQAARDEWLARVVVEEEVYAQPKPADQGEQLRSQLSELNQQGDLDRVLGRHRQNQVGQTPANFSVSQQTPPQPQPVAPVTPPPVPPTFYPSPVDPTVMPSGSTPVAPAANTVVNDLGIAPPVGESKVLNEVDNTDVPTPQPTQPAQVPPGVDPVLAAAQPVNPTTNMPADPSRDQLYQYATNVLGMNLDDEKTKAALDSQDVNQLKETLGYDPTGV